MNSRLNKCLCYLYIMSELQPIHLNLYILAVLLTLVGWANCLCLAFILYKDIYKFIGKNNINSSKIF